MLCLPQAHDEENKCNMGDTVRIDMSRYDQPIYLFILCKQSCQQWFLHGVDIEPHSQCCCRPISKRKAWVVTEIIRRENVYDPAAAAQAAAQQVPSMQQATQDASMSSRGFAASAIKG